MEQDISETYDIRSLEDIAKLDFFKVHNADNEKFNAIPEHNGNLQNLIERYGDNPGTCPFIKSLGATGLEMIQTFAASANSPNRGPTMQELMETRRNQKQAGLADQDRKVSANIKSIATTLAPTLELTPNKILTTEIDQSQKYNTPTQIEFLNQIQSEGLTSQQAIKVGYSMSELNRSVETHIMNKEALLVQSEITIDSTSLDLLENRSTNSDAYSDILAADLRAVNLRAGYNEVALKPVTLDELSEPQIAAKTTSLMPVASLDYYDGKGVTTVLEIPEITSRLDITSMTKDANYSLEFNTDTLPDVVDINQLSARVSEDNLFLPFDTLPIASESQEVISPAYLINEISQVISQLEPSRAEASLVILNQLVEAAQLSQHQTEIGSDDKIQELFVQLLDCLNLSNSHENTYRLFNSLSPPAPIKQLQFEATTSIDLLNKLGTHEYKQDSLNSILTNILQLFKSRVLSHLSIGKYVLASCLS